MHEFLHVCTELPIRGSCSCSSSSLKCAILVTWPKPKQNNNPFISSPARSSQRLWRRRQIPKAFQSGRFQAAMSQAIKRSLIAPSQSQNQNQNGTSIPSFPSFSIKTKHLAFQACGASGCSLRFAMSRLGISCRTRNIRWR